MPVFDGPQWEQYASSIGGIESGNQYDIKGGANDHYDGRWQMGLAAKKDAARALGVDVPSREEFRKNPALQQKFFQAYTQQNHKALLKKNKDYANLDPQTQMQVLGYAHNQGAGGASKWLRSGKVGKDAFGTAGTKYSDAIAAAQAGGVPSMDAPPQIQQTVDQPARPQMEAPPQDFNQAFASARQAQGAGGEFEHGGKLYNTNYKEETMVPPTQAPPVYAADGLEPSWWERLLAPKAGFQQQGDPTADADAVAAQAQADVGLGAGPQYTAGYTTVPGLSAPQAGGNSRAYPGGPDLPVANQGAGVRPQNFGHEEVPQINTAPPPPHSDEALLQGSSDQGGVDLTGLSEDALVERVNEGDEMAADEIRRRTDLVNEVDVERGDGEVSTGIPPEVYQQAEQLGIPDPSTGTSEVPGGAWQEAVPNTTAPPTLEGQFEGSPFAGYANYGQQDFVDEAENPSAGVAPGYETEDFIPAPYPEADVGVDPRGREQIKAPKQGTPESAEAVTAVVDTMGEEPGEGQSSASAEAASVDATPEQKAEGESVIKEAFGELFDKKELARMGILFAGALITGASPAQALAISGKNYLQRIDAKQSRFEQAATSGKFSATSLKEYKKTGDVTTLKPIGATFTKSGNFTTRYTKKGNAVQVEEVKDSLGNAHFQAADGTLVSGFATSGQSPKEKADAVKANSATLLPVLKGLREQFDEFETADGVKGSKTDVLPAVAAGKVAEFFIEEGVNPQEGAGIVEAAYHDMINDRRQDGSRARDIVPYLRQNIIRQKLGSHTQAFVTKPASGGNPATYVDAAKVQSLNTAATRWLSSIGAKGNTKELTNNFYTAALEDWNALDEEARKLHSKSAGEGENGFFDFTEQWLTNKIGG